VPHPDPPRPGCPLNGLLVEPQQYEPETYTVAGVTVTRKNEEQSAAAGRVPWTRVANAVAKGKVR
jgi:hypothetical protein